MKYKLVNQNTNEKGGLVGNMKEKNKMKQRKILQGSRGITLIALVITIVLNCSCLAMELMNRFEKI